MGVPRGIQVERGLADIQAEVAGGQGQAETTESGALENSPKTVETSFFGVDLSFAIPSELWGRVPRVGSNGTGWPRRRSSRCRGRLGLSAIHVPQR